MATREYEGTFKYLDESGNTNILYPKIITDETLTIEGKAADAAATGNLLKDAAEATAEAVEATAAAKEATSAANSATSAADAAATSANNAASTADSATANANAAASSANDAAASVDAAKDEAVSAAEKANEAAEAVLNMVNRITWSINESDLGLDITVFDESEVG